MATRQKSSQTPSNGRRKQTPKGKPKQPSKTPARQSSGFFTLHGLRARLKGLRPGPAAGG